MLKANVGLSRKISRDYQSTGYTINIEGEILATADDPETVLGRIHELFSLANEAMNQEIDRDQSEQAIGRRDEAPATPTPSQSRSSGNTSHREAPPQEQPQAPVQSNGSRNDEPITNKQAQFLHSLGKRHRLSAVELEGQIERTIGRRAKVYDLTKREAGKVIDALTKDEQGNGHTASRRA